MVFVSDPKIISENPITVKHFSRVGEYKNNSQKSVSFLYTNGKWTEKKIQRNNTFSKPQIT